MTEGKFMLYTLAGVLFLSTFHIFDAQILMFYDPNNYVGFHTILEFFSISISASIFLFGWKLFEATRSRNFLFLSAVFFLVGLTDLLHTLTFKGMPYFFTESSIPKATWFWVIARSIEAFFILIWLVPPDRRASRRAHHLMFFLCTVFIAAIAFFIFQHENKLPLLVIEGNGTTTLKNSIEYVVGFLHFLAIVLMLYRYYIHKKENYLYSALAFTFLFLSGLVFTIYQSVYDIDNFIGHIYKSIGYYLLMKGFLFHMVHKQDLDDLYNGNHVNL